MNDRPAVTAVDGVRWLVSVFRRHAWQNASGSTVHDPHGVTVWIRWLCRRCGADRWQASPPDRWNKWDPTPPRLFGCRR